MNGAGIDNGGGMAAVPEALILEAVKSEIV